MFRFLKNHLQGACFALLKLPLLTGRLTNSLITYWYTGDGIRVY